MWSVIPVLAIVLAQADQPSVTPESDKWCFDRGQGAQLCEETEDECTKLRSINTEIARSTCKRIEFPNIHISPTEPPPRPGG